ncbi:MAG: TonB-dependent receptor [Pyrinomonadaceae bacterium]|nr:TonB-dependent receptor [Pyrinomonadaceae bacterium]
MTKFFRFSFAALCLVACLNATVPAQSTTDGAIGGVVKDPQGAVIPNATVSVRNEETNRESTATSDDEGRFRAAQLQPGNYTVTINVQGFAPFTQPKIVVEVGRVTTLDIPLAISGSSEVVEVTGEAPVINTTQQDFSSNINQTSINELPINGRRWSNFALLTPGAVPDGAFGLISFRGVSGLLNNNTVDGGDNNQAFFSEERGRTRIPYVISQASIREFQVNTSNYSAEYGRAAGGVVNAVTKSGTNEFHGQAFFYDRDNKLGARNAFSFRTIGTPPNTQVVGLKPTDRRLQYGGAVGGPIVKDKLFFFFSFDQQKQTFPAVAAETIGSFNLTAAQQATLTARALSTAQRDAGLAFLQSITGEVPRRRDQYIVLPKIDWLINASNTFTATYNRLRAEAPAGVQSQAVVTRGIRSFGDDFVNVDSLNLRLASTISPVLLNEARFQWGRDNEFQLSQEPAPGEATTGPNGRPPSVAITNVITFGKPNFLDRRAFPDEKRWQYADTMTYTVGNHTLKFGGDINRVSDLNDNLFQEEGAYAYNNIVDFLTDFAIPSGRCGTGFNQRCYSRFNQGFGPTAFKFSTTDYNFFIQDDIRVSQRLTVNLGLRYEYQKLPEAQIPNPLAPQTSVFPSDKNNFGPRFGFAYDITGDGKTSVRGGYGIYYGRIINSTISNAITNTGVSTGQLQFEFVPTTAGSPTYPNVVATPPTGTTTRPDIIFFSQNMANPQIHQADLVFEREVAKNTVASVSLLVSLGRRLPTFVDTNLDFPTQVTPYTVVGGDLNGQTFRFPRFTNRPNAGFGRVTEIRSTIKSEYEALVLQLNRRLNKGLQFQVNYTFSKATDTGQVSQTFTTGSVPLNPFDYSLENGRTSFDIPHRFVASVVWNPTFFSNASDSRVGRAIFNGFTIAPIVQISSGRLNSAGVSGNAPNCRAPLGCAGLILPDASSTGLFGSGPSSGDRFPVFGRNSFRFPKTANVDLRLSRRFRLTETMNIEVLGEAFNLFNRLNVTDRGTRLYTVTTASATNAPTVTAGTPILLFDPLFTVPTEAGNTIFRERQIQFAARFEF